ncbi:MAG: hypothetical protein ACJ79R_22230, partial [Anaeromyxobacteraceae bacterium]
HGAIPIHLGGTVEAGIASAVATAREAARVAGRAFADHARLAPPEALAAALAPMVNLTLYVCARNAEMRDAAGKRERPANPRPTKTSAGPRLFPPDRPTTWDVGYRTGAALAAASASAGEPQGGTHASPRPHIRRAHWHHFWTGPRAGEREIALRWLPPIPVNVDDEHGIVPTIHPTE